MTANSADSRLDDMIAAASKAYDKRLYEIVEANSELPTTEVNELKVNELIGQACEDMMRESLPPLNTPNTTEDGQPRAMTISRMTFNKPPDIKKNSWTYPSPL